jgi:hypothetical protein
MATEHQTLVGVTEMAAESEPRAFLVIHIDDGGSRVIDLPDGVDVTFGRSRGATITLEHSSDQTCAPLTFSLSGGGTYTVDCANPVVAACIDSTETLTVASVPSDNYTIHVKGYVGSTLCWTNNDSLQVPSQAATLTKTLNLAYATSTPGC